MQLSEQRRPTNTFPLKSSSETLPSRDVSILAAAAYIYFNIRYISEGTRLLNFPPRFYKTAAYLCFNGGYSALQAKSLHLRFISALLFPQGSFGINQNATLHLQNLHGNAGF